MTDEVRHIVCPACNKVNRVPVDRLAAGGSCGACKQPLWPDAVPELTETGFTAHTGRSDLPVLVDFWASWCGPCKMMAPQFTEAAKGWQGKVRFAKLDTENQPGPAAKFAIRSIPTLMLFKNGAVESTKIGGLNKSQLTEFLDEHA